MVWGSTYRERRELNSDRGSSLSGGVVVGMGISGQQSRRDGTGNSVDLHYDDTSSARMVLGKCDPGVDRQIRLDAFATWAGPELLEVKERQGLQALLGENDVPSKETALERVRIGGETGV